jgi:transcriptional regulator with PAS, ATPase and Fis domain
MNGYFPLQKLHRLLVMIKEIAEAERTALFLIDREDEIFFKKFVPELNGKNDFIPIEVIHEALESKSPLFTEIHCGDSQTPVDRAAHLKRVVCIPLLGENSPAGILYLDREKTTSIFADKELSLLLDFTKPLMRMIRDHFGFNNTNKRISVSSNNGITGCSKFFHTVIDMIERIKNSEAPVFISGESGTGKELVARSIHNTSPRKGKKFIALNCGAIPENLLESELFGHTKGAFTGAARDRAGLIEEANGGTFLLDEIGDMSFYLQAKLLRLLQENEIRRVGENRTRLIDVRFISATNKSIEKEIERGTFRQDLFYRLNTISIHLAPLRERKEDILFLCDYFLQKFCEEMDRDKVHFSPQALEFMLDYAWPGNVRELKNEIQKCLILWQDESLITENFLSAKINPSRMKFPEPAYNFFYARSQFERRFLNQALDRFGYNRVKTAREIGLSRQGLFKLIKKHNISIPQKTKA